MTRFGDLADAFTGPGSIGHLFSDHKPKDCIPWQKGAHEFAQFLDDHGYRVTKTKPRKEVNMPKKTTKKGGKGKKDNC